MTKTLHGSTDESEHLARRVIDIVLRRERDAWPLGGQVEPAVLAQRVGKTITPAGLGEKEALRRWVDELAPATVAADHPRYFAFIPHAPTEASVLFDLVVSGAGLCAASWLEAAGAVHAENEALRWIADLAGFPAAAGGTFVPGGTLGTLSALHAARHAALVRRQGVRPARWKLAASTEGHSSIKQAARILDVDLIDVPVDGRHRMTSASLRAALDAQGDDGLFAVVASAGGTNLGLIDDLSGVAQVCRQRGAWLHVDGAYGLAALAAPSKRAAFAGIEMADSFTVNPHKWLFAPYDCCALVYREPAQARAAHNQSAAYLDPINEGTDWNPADYALQLSRRARGLPFWFSLAVHGTDAYAAAIETTLTLTQQAAEAIRARAFLELLIEPELSVLVFRRRGWSAADYNAWSAHLIASGAGFVVPTTFEGEPAVRIVIIDPRKTHADIERVLDSMKDAPR
ncbi:pyridoxal phosphate-dependent decarboxylase family protein [Sorangium sp. So ce1153]|uniref:pyridoxal phosphate-dependent decarboxylase family protein n=1 Tax=Sorangium sp. So ce1153 TaxID=3133333 RepID=UPI003F62B5AE